MQLCLGLYKKLQMLLDEKGCRFELLNCHDAQVLSYWSSNNGSLAPSARVTTAFFVLVGLLKFTPLLLILPRVISV